MKIRRGRSRLPTPPLSLKFSVLGPSVRGKQGEPHRPMIPLTGSADDGKRPSLDVTFTRGVQGGKLNLPLRGTPASTGRRIWPAGGRLPWVLNFGFQGLFRALHFCTTSSIEINILHIVCERCMRFGCVKFWFFFVFFLGPC